MTVFRRLLLVGLVSLLGCGPAPQPAAQSDAVSEDLAVSYDAAQTGEVRGRVFWKGPMPSVPPLLLRQTSKPTQVQANPHTPVVDLKSGGLANSMVLLRGVQLSRSRPWDHDPVRVEIHPDALQVHQGKVSGTIGLVRKGADITVVNRTAEIAGLRCRDVEFFSLPLVRADRPSVRRLDREGHIELSCSYQQYGLRGHLLVSAHPYVAHTDAHGNFVLPQVPTGSYELVAMLPSWEIESRECEPEIREWTHIRFRPPLEKATHVEVRHGETSDVSLTFSQVDNAVSPKR